MFKKTLIALALASAAMTANAASKVEIVGTATATTPHAISFQTLTAAKTATLGNVDVALDIDDTAVLIDGAKMVITLSGAVFNSGVAALAGAGSSGATSTDEVNAGSSVTYTLANLTGYTDGQTIRLTGLPLILDSVDSDVKITVSFLTAGNAPLSGVGAAATTVATVANEWTVAIAKLDAQIDVAAKREKFTGGALTDTLGFTFKDIDTNTTIAAIVDYTVTITGDFTNIASVAGYTINTAKNEAKATFTPADADDLSAEAAAANAVFTIVSGANAVTLTEQDYGVSVEVKYNTNKTFALATATADNAGGFEFNSTSTTLNYAPFGPNTQLILNATSTFDVDASVDVTYVSPVTMKSVTLTDIGTAAANTVTKLGDVVAQAILDEEGIASGKTSLTVSVNAPSGTVTYFTGFKDKADGSRMTLEQVTTTQADAAAIKADLANAVDGLGALSTGIAASGTASTKAANIAAVATIVAAKDANTQEVYNTGEFTAINTICASIDATFVLLIAEAGASTAVADGGASASTNVCGLDD